MKFYTVTYSNEFGTNIRVKIFTDEQSAGWFAADKKSKVISHITKNEKADKPFLDALKRQEEESRKKQRNTYKPKVYICDKCGEVFTEDEMGSRTERMPDFWGFPAYDSFACCPCCGSDEFSEAEVCRRCHKLHSEGEMIHGFCEDCRYIIKKRGEEEDDYDEI